MDMLDIVLIVVCLGFALSGYRQGFVVGFLAFIGFLGGGALGAKYANSLHSQLHFGMDPALFGLLVVVICALLGQMVATLIGASLRREMTWRPLRTLDSVAGGVVSVVSVLIIAWLVGTALANASSAGVSRQVRNSSVLQGVDARHAEHRPDLVRLVSAAARPGPRPQRLPRGLWRDRPERCDTGRTAEPEAGAKSGGAACRAGRREDHRRGDSCSRQLEGSGFIFATGPRHDQRACRRGSDVAHGTNHRRPHPGGAHRALRPGAGRGRS